MLMVCRSRFFRHEQIFRDRRLVYAYTTEGTDLLEAPQLDNSYVLRMLQKTALGKKAIDICKGHGI
jgi:hypothetical protein